MQRSFFRTAIIGVAALALCACTAVRLGYNQGPQLGFWWLDRYLDFDDAQELRARDAIAEWFRWHRTTQLPDYAALLARAQQEVTEPLTPAQACQWADTLKTRLDAAFEHALPALADAVRDLGPQQLEHLQRKYARNINDYRRDFLQADPQERRRAQVKRVAERVEMLYGRLSDAQRERIATLTAQSPLDPQGALVERERRQADALQALRRLNAEHAGAEAARAVVRRLYAETFESPRAHYRAYQQNLMQFNCAFAAQVHELATPEQRGHAAKRLKGWEEDARALAAQAQAR
jgi:hypothetical protein